MVGTNSRKISSFLGLNRKMVLIFLATITIGTGEHLWLGFIPKYLEILGATVFVIGLSDFIATILAAIYGFPGGVVTDRFGIRKSLIFFTFLSLAGYLILLISPGWPAVIIGMFFYLAFSNLAQLSLEVWRKAMITAHLFQLVVNAQ